MHLLSISIGLLLALDTTAATGNEPSTRGLPPRHYVTNCDDHGPGSLRDVLAAAASGDSIDLSQLTCSVITLTSGELITYLDNVDLSGSITISSANSSRVLSHKGQGTLHIHGLTIADGMSSSDWITAGGCIYTRGSLQAFDVTVRNCTATSRRGTVGMVLGGGVFASKDAFLLQTSIIDNAVVSENDHDIARGGGIYAGNLRLLRSTISGNTVDSKALSPSSVKAGGGFYSQAGVYIAYSTISGNSADFGGGGRQSGTGYDCVSTIKHSTISGNMAHLSAGGIVSTDALLKIWNSTIAFNASSRSYAEPIPDCGGILFMGGDEYLSLRSSIVANNRIGDAASDVCAPPHVAPIIGYGNLVIAANRPLPADTIQLDPMLEPLGYNGGSTETHALRPGSPAIDSGNNSSWASYDQRGFPRIAGAGTDIGAFELQSDTIFIDSFD